MFLYACLAINPWCMPRAIGCCLSQYGCPSLPWAGGCNAVFGIARLHPLVGFLTGCSRCTAGGKSLPCCGLAFIVYFSLGGMTGLLAVPPADFVLHNSLFLVAHFLADSWRFVWIFRLLPLGFPKMFGYREVWGKRFFWAWDRFRFGFHATYSGLMGMPRAWSTNQS